MTDRKVRETARAKEALGAPERYPCKPYACEPPDLEALGMDVDGCEWLPNDKTWLWHCAHGRPFFLRWDSALTVAEIRDMVENR
jgi:hypothetical protein